MNKPLETESGHVAERLNHGIKYRHYLLTKHCLTRFRERTHLSLSAIYGCLDRAVIAEARQQKDYRVQKDIQRAEESGGYVLIDPENALYFFIAIGADRLHNIIIVMTEKVMTCGEFFL